MNENDQKLVKEIKDLKREKNAVILAHNYQLSEIQDIADVTGDSLALSRLAANATEKVIVFCGVKFMAETAATLAPDKIVLLPVLEAGCRLSDMIDVSTIKRLRADNPGCPVVCYVNSSAEVKAESDVVCTSANAAAVVNSLHEDRIIFVPDRNLGSFVAKKTGKKLIIPEGYCPSHERIRAEEIKDLKRNFPGAKVVVHPECSREVVELADAVESTGGMQRYVKNSTAKMFIVGTEIGMLYRLRTDNPGKIFIAGSEQGICPDMKYIRLVDLRDSLKKNKYRVEVGEEIRGRALKAVERMIATG